MGKSKGLDKYGRDWNSSHEYRIRDYVEHWLSCFDPVSEGKKGIDLMESYNPTVPLG